MIFWNGLYIPASVFFFFAPAHIFLLICSWTFIFSPAQCLWVYYSSVSRISTPRNCLSSTKGLLHPLIPSHNIVRSTSLVQATHYVSNVLIRLYIIYASKLVESN